MRELEHLLGEMFAWPQGIVIGNLIASALTTTIAHVWLHKHLHKHLHDLRDSRVDPHSTVASTTELGPEPGGESIRLGFHGGDGR